MLSVTTNDFHATPTMRLTIGDLQQLELTSHQVVSGSFPVALCVVFDTTGLMLTHIASLSDCVNEMTRQLTSAGVARTMTVAPSGDLKVVGDTINTDFPWVSSTRTVAKLLDSMPQNSGGANGGESFLENIDAGVSRLREREHAAKVFLFLTDEARHCDTSSDDDVAIRLINNDILVYAVATNSLCEWFTTVTGGGLLEMARPGDLSMVTLSMSLMGRKMAVRAEQVWQSGGSAHFILASETGR